MLTRQVKLAVAALCALGAARSFAAPYTWTDAKSGREYQLLETEMTWNQAERACHSRGYALSDLRYLGDEERKDFLASTALEKLSWEKLYEGTSRETRITHIWQSAQAGTAASNGASYGSTQIVVQKRGDAMTTTEEWHGEDDTARGVCMATDAFWYYCNIHYVCTYRYTGGQYSITSMFIDYGATENEALRRIIERTEASANAGDGECKLDTASKICLRELP